MHNCHLSFAVIFRWLIAWFLIFPTANLQAQISVSGGTGLAATYTTFTRSTGLFAALNANPQAGNNIIVTVTANITNTIAAGGEDGTVALNENTWISLTIKPSGARSVQQTLTSPLFTFNGADNVTIDGLNSSGNSLIIQNLSTATTAGTSTIKLYNDASNNTFTRCSILGASRTPLTTEGGNIVFGSGTTSGNDNNNISLCNIGSTSAMSSNSPTKGVFSIGSVSSTTIRNSGNNISNNNIYDVFNAARSSAGMYIGNGNDLWLISSNRIYQTLTCSFSGAGLRSSAIFINTTTFPGSFTLSTNVIGYSNSIGSGTSVFTYSGSGAENEWRGIDIANVNTTTATSIQGNIITSIRHSTARSSNNDYNAPFVAIAAGVAATGAGDGLFNIGNITGNQIGSVDNSNTIVVNSATIVDAAPVIGIMSLAPRAINISNNTIGSITISADPALGIGETVGFIGIQVNSAVTGITATINGNIIGGTSAAAGIKNDLTGFYFTYGIFVNKATASCNNNIVRNINTNAKGQPGTVLTGIFLQSALAACTVQFNTIHSISNTCTVDSASNLYCIDLDLPVAGNVVSHNFIHSVSLTGTNVNSQILGIVIRSGTSSVYNNMIRLGIDANGNALTTGFIITGLRDAGGTNNYYHNSVYIGGTGVTGSTSRTAAFYSDVLNVTRNFKNNIFMNARSNTSAGAGNFALRLAQSSNVTGLNSNNNILFATGTDSYLGYFNSVAYSTLAAWQAATGQDANSLNVNPLFLTPAGTAATVNLHVDPSSPADAAATPVGITNDYDGQTRSSTTPDIGADEIDGAPVYNWVGGFSTDWNTGSNWSSGIVPNSTTNALVNGGFPFLPLVSSAQDVKSITITLGTVTITGKLNIYGDINATTGSFIASAGSIQFSGTSTTQNISGSWFTGRNLSSLIISNPVGVNNSTASLDTLRILSSLSFGSVTSSTFSSGNNLTFVSSDTATAALGKILNSNIFTGTATVERYIPNHPRAWQFLSIPATGQTIKDAWQESAASVAQNLRPGYGTIITSNVSNPLTQGFDIISSTPSMKSYNPISNGWDGVSSTFNAIANPNGYMLFVRGDRTVTAFNQTATTLKLRTSGSLFTPSNPPSSIAVAAGLFASCGNPYPSAIDFTQITRTGGVQNLFYVWDPKMAGGYGLGSYQTLTWNGTSFTVTPGGGSYTGSNRNIESGQAFFIASSASAGSISFSENCKVSGSALVNRTTAVNSSLCVQLQVLFNSQPVLLDGVRIEFDPANNVAVDEQDARKLDNFGENLGIFRNEKKLVVERWKQPELNDSFPLFLNQMRQQNYILRIIPDQFHPSALTGYVVDRFLNTATTFSFTDTTHISFSVNATPGSYAFDRFKIEFRLPAALPVNITHIQVTRKSKTTADIKWMVEQESSIREYELLRSVDGTHFYPIAVLAPGASNNQYLVTDRNVDERRFFYKVKAIGITGDVQYSSIVKLVPLPSEYVIYPNPVLNNELHIAVPEYNKHWEIHITNHLQQVVYVGKKVGDPHNINILLPHLPSGVYSLYLKGKEHRSLSFMIP